MAGTCSVSGSDPQQRREEVEGFLARYESRLLPEWLAHRVEDAKSVVLAMGDVTMVEAPRMLAALCGFMRWHGRDEPLESSLTRQAVHEWSAQMLAGRMRPGTHDHRLRSLYAAIDVIDGVYRPRSMRPRVRKEWMDDATLARVIELAGTHAGRRGMVAACAGAGLVATGSPVSLWRCGSEVFACRDGVTRRVLDEFAHLVDGPVTVTRSTVTNFSVVLSKARIRSAQVTMRRSWRRRVLCLRAPARVVLAGFPMSDQVIEDVLHDLPTGPWRDVATMLRGYDTTGGC